MNLKFMQYHRRNLKCLKINEMNRLIVSLILCGGALVYSCTKEQTSTILPLEQHLNTKPLRFSSEDELVEAINENKNDTYQTKSSSDFKSYYQTVMQEDDYDDRPNAILSDAFGSILNPDGEVVYGSTLIKVGKEGIFYGPEADSLKIRDIASQSAIAKLCREAVCPYISKETTSYAIDGLDGIYAIDTFGYIAGINTTAEEDVPFVSTKVYVDGTFQEINTNANLLFGGTGMAADWSKDFVKPKSGSQKVKFSDKKHCNDTKMYQQHYGVDSDDGIKTKTMKKRLGTIWDKVNNPLEAGIKNISLYVQANFAACKNDDICHMTFAGREYDVYVEQSRSRSSNWAIGLSNASVISEISKGKKFATDNNISIVPSAVMFVLSNDAAVVRFEDKYRYESNNSVMIIKWRTPFGGTFAAKNSHMNGNWKEAGIFHVEKLDAYACSIRGDVKKGTMMHYTYQDNGSK